MHITQNAPAKINLTLDILSKDKSGYHHIQTILQKIELHDTISVKKGRKGLTIRSNTDIPPKNNIITKTHKLLEEVFQQSFPVEISLEKNIPIGGGLGGGSSNAATYIQIIRNLFDIKAPEKTWFHIAESIGMDVPFFLNRANTALGTHFGEKIKPLPSISPCKTTLLIPPFKSDTKNAYAHISLSQCGKNTQLTEKLQNKIQTPEIEKYCHNDFEITSNKKDQQKNFKHPIHLTGSGSCLFMLKHSPSSQEKKQWMLSECKIIETKFLTD